MKKIILILVLWFVAAGMAVHADSLRLSGYVYDSATGAGLNAYPVYIDIDSTNTGFSYHRTVFTMHTGFYADTIVFNTGSAPTGIARISVWNCLQQLRSETVAFSPGHLVFTRNFTICTGTPPPPCHADFYPIAAPPPPTPMARQFINTSVGANGPWLWSFGDGTTSTLFDPIHVFAANGVYHVTLSMGDTMQGGCFDSRMHEIVIGDTTGCHADFSATLLTPPLTMQFHNLSTGTNGPWFWSFGDGSSATTFDPHHTYAAPGLYQVSLSIGDSNAGCWDFVSKMIQVGDTMAGCHAQFTWYCDTNTMNTTVHFINQSVPETGTWFWNFGDSTHSTDKNPTHTYATNGLFNVCLTITSTNPQCTHTECHLVAVGPPPPPPCENWITHVNNWLDVSFEGHLAGDPPATYSWMFGDGSAGTGKNVTHHFAAPGFYPVTLTTVILDSNQCTWVRTINVLVGDSSNIHQVYGQVFAGNFPLNFGMAMIFSTTPMPGGMPFVAVSLLDSMGIYVFPYVPDGEFVIWALPFDSAGAYLPTFFEHSLYWEQANKITLGNPQNPYNIHLLQCGNMPVGPGGVNGHVNTTGLKSAQVNEIAMILTDEAGNPLGFRKVSPSGNFDFSGMAYGTYYLKPELPNISSDLVKVVLSAANPVATVTMTYNGSNILGVSETSAVESFVAYPNPVNNVLNLTLKLNTSANVTAEIYSFTGQKVVSQDFSLSLGANTLSLDLGMLNSGLYTLRMTSPEGIRIVQKFVKK